MPLQKSGQGITNPNSAGCACHCATDTAAFQVWQQKHGPPDSFAAKAVGMWFNRILTPRTTGQMFTKTELLILLGRSAKGIWCVEAQMTDNEGAIYADLVCTTKGKRKVIAVIKGFTIELEMGQIKPEGVSEPELSRRREQVVQKKLNTLVLRRLRQLAKTGQWDAAILNPMQLPLLSKPPALIFHEEGKPDTEGYGWSVNVKAKGGRLERVVRHRPPGGFLAWYFRAAKCFGGVKDASGETWWVLVKTALADTCSAEWYSIRLTHSASAKQ